MIAQFYKRFNSRNMHQTYNLTKECERKLVLIPLRGHYKCFINTFYDFKNMHLNRLDDVNDDINELNYTTEDIKILEGFNPILEINQKF